MTAVTAQQAAPLAANQTASQPNQPTSGFVYFSTHILNL